MKIVVDTNVLMSGIFFGGVPGRVIEAWVNGKVTVVLSPVILEEYHRVGRVLGGRYPERAAALTPLLALLTMNATIVNAVPLAQGVSADPADDMFLAAAVESGAPAIVSGDAHLLELSGWSGISVLTPRQFVDRHLRVG